MNERKIVSTELTLTFFPPEWYEQDGVMLTWPHLGTDWIGILPEVEKTYVEIAREIIKREKLIIVCPDRHIIKNKFSEEELFRILFAEIPSNDTWARDHGPVCTLRNMKPVINDFGFNGWGGRFNADKDNEITKRLFDSGVFIPDSVYLSQPGFILEGGSIETDGAGTILTTSACLLNANRNRTMSAGDIELRLKEVLGATRVLWLNHGYLEGDDTDSHIDTLARFCSEKTICYVQCRDQEDIHFETLKKMEQQLQGFRTVDGKPYQLVPLPMVPPMHDEDGKRLPATYANFLIINKALLLPVYGQGEDKEAVRIMKKTFPGREIIEINCLSLIKQYGSLHCITMQIPKAFLV
jgi:agmatine deiminase